MLERIITHPAGRFPRCRGCGAEPRHILARGRASHEPTDIFHPIGIRHSLECRCDAHTARYALLITAEADWSINFAQLALPQRKPVAA